MHLNPGILVDKEVVTVARGSFHQLLLVRHLWLFLGREGGNCGAVVASRLNCHNALYVGQPLGNVCKLLLLQNPVARVLTGVDLRAHIIPVLFHLH